MVAATMTIERVWLTIAEAAERVNRAERTIHQLIERDNIRAEQANTATVKNGPWLVFWPDVEDFYRDKN